MKRRKIVSFIVFISLFLSAATRSVGAFSCSSASDVANATKAQKESCQSELNALLRELADLEAKSNVQKKQAGTLKGDITLLSSQIAALKTKIKARSVAIAELKANINEKVKTINSLSSKIEREHESLAKLLRNTNEFDNQNIVHLILSDEDISDFYGDLESYAAIKQAVKDSVDAIKGVKKQTEAVKSDLEKKRNAETDAKAELENAQKKVAQTEEEKKKLLSITNSNISAYAKQQAEKAAKAAQIRAALFPLANTSKKIEFGTALAYANEAKRLTGVDPAFLLAVLTQESNLGSNVGQCYLTDQATGAGIGKNTGTVFPNVMKPMGLPGRKGDVADFLRITSKLGLVWNQTAISCPIAGAGGYGGAMGPAQFIPTTWTIFEGRLKNLLGRDASPWEPKDAFMASSMYLTDLGGIGTSQSAQNIAACKYYGTGGASCAYSQSVARLKATIQANIDLLSG